MMFRRPTVVVVGAGASKELNLPIGLELSKKIIEMATCKFDQWGEPATKASSHLRSVIHSRAGGHAAKMEELFNAANKIVSALPFKDSIDAVIDQYHDELHVAEIGKYLIARLILEAEGNSALRPLPANQYLPDLAAADGAWLKTFARMLFEGLRKDELDNIGDNVTIVCFNYDRCIELYLMHAVANAYKLPLTEAAKVAAKVRIHHVYGYLGQLPEWPSDDTGIPATEFGKDRADFWRVATGLQTFSESRDSSTDDLIKAAVGKAEQYIYLGLSFGRQNMELLSVPRSPGGSIQRPVYASAFGLSQQSIPAIQRLLQRTYNTSKIPMDQPTMMRSTDKTHVEIEATARKVLDIHWHSILG